jgi:hypothetical protein
MIESQDINDKDILERTRKESGQNGTFRLKYTLPNGQELISEWVRPENGKKALRNWVEYVRQAVPEAVRTMAAEKGAAARREALDAMLAEPPAASTVPSREQDRDCKPEGLTPESDPVHHAKNQVALLEAEVRHWSETVQTGEKHLKNAQDKLRKWNQIVASFEAGDVDDKQE